MFRDLYYKKTTIDDIERKQDEFDGVIGALKSYAPRDNKYVQAKSKLLNNVENLYNRREKIIEGFKNGVFPFYYDKEYERQVKIQKEAEEMEKEAKREARRKKREEPGKQDRRPFHRNEYIEWLINNKEAHINNEMFKKHFKVQTPSLMYRVLR